MECLEVTDSMIFPMLPFSVKKSSSRWWGAFLR